MWGENILSKRMIVTPIMTLWCYCKPYVWRQEMDLLKYNQEMTLTICLRHWNLLSCFLLVVTVKLLGLKTRIRKRVTTDKLLISICHHNLRHWHGFYHWIMIPVLKETALISLNFKLVQVIEGKTNPLRAHRKCGLTDHDSLLETWGTVYHGITCYTGDKSNRLPYSTLWSKQLGCHYFFLSRWHIGYQ